jgi:putative oxidoreductase
MSPIARLISRLSHPFPQLPASFYALPLRLIVGFGFVMHGYAKLARGPESFIHILDALGVPAPFLMAWATILIELVCGALMLVGLFIPLISVPMVVVLLVAIFTVHLPNGFSSIKLESVTSAGAHFGQPGYETDLLYIAAIVALVLGGSGPLSIDGLFRRRQ